MQKLHRGSRIIGSGHYCPEKILSNFDLEKIVETSDEWIRTRTGIRERRIANEQEASSDLALLAAEAALKDAGIKADDIDGVIVGTVTPDMQFPATACLVQDRLGAKNAAAFDLGAACSGFIYGLNTAHGLIVSGQMNTVLVVGVEVLSKFLDWQDRATCVLFGDGAGAAVLGPCDPDDGILGTYMRSDGSLADLLWIPAGGSRAPISEFTYQQREHYIKMKGDGVFKYAVRAMVDATSIVLKQADLDLEQVDHLIPHQANIRIIDAVIGRLGIPEEKVVVNIDRFGNTSSATIPIAFDEVRKSGKIKSGDIVLFVAFGGGFTWGSVLFRHTEPAGRSG
ncbi:MAG: beta-ketoacyl-ACP synthase III [Candidatus Latescibacteria bacterium]|nr:beta-ketoacyl-ACP synthase III [Candidatus Latescibacterota bacterium]NIM20980.1 beta-ketoacyl-ACP synthase III [Candidatus Latescibacterota bacterium]NIM65115.1 beta-ketoacyl-ACP synthase III [Candidatus Latescibacterota bacterium]NIO01630.1 beta-ketoacyl-ACP synthase III [Candidatus Latescibacterota bacterium]NIO28147.1 beta-ketoacyl-ACP synthase III [Candidatus Latescibacterota bacterium]